MNAPIVSLVIRHPDKATFESAKVWRKSLREGALRALVLCCQRAGHGFSVSELKFSENRAPYVENDRLFVGLSHTEGYCAAAVAVGYPVGIDVQTLKPIHSRLRRAVGEPREWPLLGNGQSEDETFMVLFSAKEAVLKGERRGFSTGKRLLQCHLQAVETQGIYRRLLIHTERNRWKVRTQTLDNGKAVFSLAVPQAVSVPKINFAFES